MAEARSPPARSAFFSHPVQMSSRGKSTAAEKACLEIYNDIKNKIRSFGFLSLLLLRPRALLLPAWRLFRNNRSGGAVVFPVPCCTVLVGRRQARRRAFLPALAWRRDESPRG